MFWAKVKEGVSMVRSTQERKTLNLKRELGFLLFSFLLGGQKYFFHDSAFLGGSSENVLNVRSTKISYSFVVLYPNTYLSDL